jgi:hypothetical protein
MKSYKLKNNKRTIKKQKKTIRKHRTKHTLHLRSRINMNGRGGGIKDWFKTKFKRIFRRKQLNTPTEEFELQPIPQQPQQPIEPKLNYSTQLYKESLERIKMLNNLIEKERSKGSTENNVRSFVNKKEEILKMLNKRRMEGANLNKINNNLKMYNPTLRKNSYNIYKQNF